MKNIISIFVLSLWLITSISNAQDITNTLAPNGNFKVKDGATEYLSLSQSTGYLTLNRSLVLPVTTSPGLGVIYKGADRFIHNYGSNNTFIGRNSGNFTMTGSHNTASGYQSLYSNTTGYSNTANGGYALVYNTTGFNNTTLGFETGNSITTGSNLTCIGNNAEPTSGTAANQITLGNSSVTSLRCNVTTITSLSDARDKKNIKDLSLGINFLMKLKPRIYNWDKREWYDDNNSDGSKMKEEPTAGFIAQELDEVQTEENAEWLNLVLKDNPEKWEATPGNLFPVMVKAIQELNEENQKLKVKNQNLEDRLTRYEEMQTILVKKMEHLESNEQLFKVQLVNSENNNQ